MCAIRLAALSKVSENDTALAGMIGFGRALRAEGLSIGTGQVLEFCRAAAIVAGAEAGDRNALYWAGHATLINRIEDRETYERVFDGWFGAPSDQGRRVRGRSRLVTPLAKFPRDPQRSSLEASEEQSPERFIGTAASSIEVLKKKSFELLTDNERRVVDRMIHSLHLHAPLRTGRRTRPHHAGDLLDLRRTLRTSLRFHGEVARHRWRRRRQEPRRLVLLLDVSGSMASYSRAMLQFAHVAARTNAKVEVFCFGTRLTRITQSLRQRHPEDALDGAVRKVTDWEGGTRIGECIGDFLRTYGRHVLSRGAVVVICSDGLERGDPEFLARQMSRLHRLAHRTVWVNPLKGDPSYRPLARGMHSALPHLDLLLPGHNLASLEELADVLKLTS